MPRKFSDGQRVRVLKPHPDCPHRWQGYVGHVVGYFAGAFEPYTVELGSKGKTYRPHFHPRELEAWPEKRRAKKRGK